MGSFVSECSLANELPFWIDFVGLEVQTKPNQTKPKETKANQTSFVADKFNFASYDPLARTRTRTGVESPFEP